MGRDTVPGLAQILRAAREAAGLTQQEAADRSGVHAVSIARFETEVRGPSVATLYKLAEAYGTTVCKLLPEMKPNPPSKKGKK